MPEALWALLLLPVAAASGWYIRGRTARRDDDAGARPAQADYLRGIHYLVNDESDRAIESFVRVLDVDNDTVEIHLALGNLFRRRGEVDRALRVHQNLTARPKLGTAHRNQARHELARDYLHAGVLDRAEKLYSELLDQKQFREPAMRGLIVIYEQERDWQRAIDISRQLESVTGDTRQPIIAQYNCELAAQSLDDHDLDATRRYLKQARRAHRGCVRASLLHGLLAERLQQPRRAIRYYGRVVDQDDAFVSETIDPVRRCFAAMDDMPGYGRYLDELIRRTDNVQAHVARARLLHARGRTDEAIAHLSSYLQEQTNWYGFHEMLELARVGTDSGLTGPLNSLRQSLDRMIEHQANYRCLHCGFSGRQLYWQCPGCRQWNQIIPVNDVQPAPGAV